MSDTHVVKGKLQTKVIKQKVIKNMWYKLES